MHCPARLARSQLEKATMTLLSILIIWRYSIIQNKKQTEMEKVSWIALVMRSQFAVAGHSL
jgi:hypothetical protein